MISGLSKIAFYDTATGDVVQLNSLSTESTVVIKEPFTVENGKGNQVFAGEQSQVEVTAYDSTGFDELEAWMQAETELRMVAFGIEGHIIWNEDAPITVKRNIYSAVGQRNSFTVSISAKGGEQDIHFGNNLLFLAKGWEDANSDEVADNFTLSASGGLIAKTFTSGLQEINADTPLSGLSFYTNLVFPISGISLNFFNNVSQDDSASGNIKVVEKNFAGTVLQTNTQTSLDDTVIVTTDATIYSLDLYLIDAGVMDAGNIDLQQPYLGTKTSGIIQY